MKRLSALLVVCLAYASFATATSVLPLSVDDLIRESETVFIGRVVAVRSAWRPSRNGDAIVTNVTFSIDRVLKGPNRIERTLQFLGGTVGQDTLRVSGLPVFQVGERDVLFVNETGQPVSPLVGLMQGRFRVSRPAGASTDVVQTFDGKPVLALSDIGKRPMPSPPGAAPMTLGGFVSALDGRIRDQGRR
jgi:hypothetical protein